MARLPNLVAVGAGALLFVGCARLGTPNWCDPGPAPAQQRRATKFDPYPDPTLGPSDGGERPRGFESPPPAASRYWSQPDRALPAAPLY